MGGVGDEVPPGHRDALERQRDLKGRQERIFKMRSSVNRLAAVAGGSSCLNFLELSSLSSSIAWKLNEVGRGQVRLGRSTNRARNSSISRVNTNADTRWGDPTVERDERRAWFGAAPAMVDGVVAELRLGNEEAE
jgi:hypothetical protein